MVVKSSAWVGRQQIFMFVRDGQRIIPPTELTPDDYLILNVSFAGPHLSAPVRDSAHIDAMTPIEFAYPLDPQGRAGEAKFSAFGIIGGEMKRAAEQVIPQDDTAVFILATRGAQGKIQLVTSQTILGESDPLAQSLVRGQARPLLVGGSGKASETTKKGPGAPAPAYGGNGTVITGRTFGVEYGVQGASLWIRMADGTKRRLRLHNVQDSIPCDKESKLVKVHLDESGEYADDIFLELAG